MGNARDAGHGLGMPSQIVPCDTQPLESTAITGATDSTHILYFTTLRGESK